MRQTLSRMVRCFFRSYDACGTKYQSKYVDQAWSQQGGNILSLSQVQVLAYDLDHLKELGHGNGHGVIPYPRLRKLPPEVTRRRAALRPVHPVVRQRALPSLQELI